jgi:hypothetical protein
LVSKGVSSMWLQQHQTFWNAMSNIEGNWIMSVCEDNLKMMSSSQNASKARWQQCDGVTPFNH